MQKGLLKIPISSPEGEKLHPFEGIPYALAFDLFDANIKATLWPYHDCQGINVIHTSLTDGHPG